jgi:hypothetical protein
MASTARFRNSIVNSIRLFQVLKRMKEKREFEAERVALKDTLQGKTSTREQRPPNPICIERRWRSLAGDIHGLTLWAWHSLHRTKMVDGRCLSAFTRPTKTNFYSALVDLNR